MGAAWIILAVLAAGPGVQGLAGDAPGTGRTGPGPGMHLASAGEMVTTRILRAESGPVAPSPALADPAQVPLPPALPLLALTTAILGLSALRKRRRHRNGR